MSNQMTSFRYLLRYFARSYVYESLMFATLEKENHLFLKSKLEAVAIALLHDNNFPLTVPYTMRHDF